MLAHLADRAVISIGGEDAADFLAGLVTCAVPEDGAGYGALLTPQGKIIADFFLLPRRDGERGFLVDVSKLVAETLLKRLTMYKLRAKVTVADGAEPGLRGFRPGASAPGGCGGRHRSALWRDGPALSSLRAPSPLDATPRSPITTRTASRSPFRKAGAISPMATPSRTRPPWISSAASISRRAAMWGRRSCRACSIAARPAPASRRLRFSESAPAEGAELRAGDKVIGKVGSVDAKAGRAIGLLRLDRLADALAAKESLVAGEAVLHAEKPALGAL